MFKIVRTVFVATVAVAALASCSSDPVPVDTFYRLEPSIPQAARAGGPITGIAEVVPLRGAGIVNGRAILYRRSATELRPYSYHFWADTPPSMLQRDLIEALRAAQAFDSVVPPEMRLNRDYEIMGKLHKIEQDLSQGSPRVVLEIELGVRKIRGNDALLLKVYRAEVQTNSDGVSAAVSGFSRALNQIFTEFIVDLGQVQG